MQSPSIPPQVKRRMPRDPFEAWLMEQAVLGHDRQWLERNRVGLKQRWERDQTPLELPRPTQPTYDRMKEI